jgi:adenosylcobinamide-phosphate synthase
MLQLWLLPTYATPSGLGQTLALALLMALVVDLCLGEPPVRWHPVVWIGRALQRCAPWVLPRVQPHASAQAYIRGLMVWVVLAAGVCMAAAVVQGLAVRLPWLGAALVVGVGLKPLMAWRMLRDEVQAVERALGQSIDLGRARLGWLVSRDVTQLTAVQVRESAIESLAKNLNDSVVAPIFWFVLLGLPGAALYRFANTADAMWGYPGVYKGHNWEWPGKWAARADDVLNWLTARLTGVLLVLCSAVRALWALRTLRREAARTPSPNSGWPMAAMALALDVCLHKPGVYALHSAGRAPQAPDTARACGIARNTLYVFVGLSLVAIYFIQHFFS